MQKRILKITMVFLFIGSSLFAGGKKDASTGNQNNVPPPVARPAQVIPAHNPVPAAPAPNPFYTGSGGKDVSLAILAPQGMGLAEDQNYLPALVQGEFVSNFSGYSAISVLDRENLDKLFAETLSGYYEDYAEGVIRLGHMTNTDYIMTGTISKTSSGYTLQMQIASSADGMTRASYSGPCTIAELDNFTGIRRASAELLEKMDVALTERAKTELAGAATEQSVNAQTALAKGIEALRQGTVVEALSYFIQSSNTDPQLAEAASRVNILSANISSGNIGDDTRNDIQWRKQWVERLAEAEAFYANYTKVPPYYLTYSTDIKQGDINYAKETVALSFSMNLLPEAVWVSTINEIMATVKLGLNATGRVKTWGIDWPEKSINAAAPIAGQKKNLAVTAEIINAEGKSIGRQTVSLPYGWISNGGIMTPLFQKGTTASFPDVDANLITDQLTIRISSLDGIQAETAAKQKKISILPYGEYNQIPGVTANGMDSDNLDKFTIGATNDGRYYITRYDGSGGNVVIPIIFSVTTIESGAFAGKQLTSVTIPNSVTTIKSGAFRGNWLTSVTIPNSVTTIGDRTFADNQLTSVTIPNSVTAIESFAFYNNRLTSVIIPNSVTTIMEGAFSGNRLTSITIGGNVSLSLFAFADRNSINLGYVDIYTGNGRKAGTYTYNEQAKRWYYSPQ